MKAYNENFVETFSSFIAHHIFNSHRNVNLIDVQLLVVEVFIESQFGKAGNRFCQQYKQFFCRSVKLKQSLGFWLGFENKSPLVSKISTVENKS